MGRLKMSKKVEAPTILKHIRQILGLVESLLTWDSIPWHIKKIWIENVINRLEILKEIANAEIAMEEK